MVGSGRDADLVLADPSVSRRHLLLELAPEGLAVTDLGSSNGTFYLGQRVERATLGFGSRVRIGATELLFEPDVAPVPGDLAEEGLQSYRGLTGASPAMRRLFSLLTRLEGSLAHVLVEGPSGSGKELVARAIQSGSVLANRPFVSLNCGAIGRELVLSELFGHRRGAFTGAHENRRGAFDEAHEGTLFLDEVGELPLDVQPALLRALELGEIRSLGETQARRVKVRVLAATNRNLERDVKQGLFRQDLYYRLAVVKVRVPALHERPEDIPLLAERIALDEGAGTLPADFVAALQSRAWEGNVRELRNAVQSYLALGETQAGAETDPLESALEQMVAVCAPYGDQKEAVLSTFTRLYVRAMLRRTGGNQSEAARLAGLDRGYFGRLLAKGAAREAQKDGGGEGSGET